ncbi:Uncharacterized protein TCM_010390 [Theobroma cacao]|uniref:Uncharacterized protein n=1 Tax=Theobroma cacao TaxID=3641 RepID=A0A061E6A2_THECC|nr:Uncharacterized protein TCM_010390 [Theobroma cacao]
MVRYLLYKYGIAVLNKILRSEAELDIGRAGLRELQVLFRVDQDWRPLCLSTVIFREGFVGYFYNPTSQIQC